MLCNGDTSHVFPDTTDPTCTIKGKIIKTKQSCACDIAVVLIVISSKLMLQIVLHQETSQCKTDNQWSLHVFYELLIQIHGLAKENYKINKLI